MNEFEYVSYMCECGTVETAKDYLLYSVDFLMQSLSHTENPKIHEHAKICRLFISVLSKIVDANYLDLGFDYKDSLHI